MKKMERIGNPDGSEIVQCYRRSLEAIIAMPRTSAELRARLQKLLDDATYDMIWVDTDAEFDARLRDAA